MIQKPETVSLDLNIATKGNPTTIYGYQICAVYLACRIEMKLTSFLSESVYLAALATSAAVDVTEGDLAATSPTVDLGYSIYRGTRLQGGVDQYLGMRYAQAPLGDLRFRAPRQPLATMGIQDASRVRYYRGLNDVNANQFIS